jgi:hypothetical protein
MSVRAWLAVTDDMPAFCEWFGRAVGARRFDLSSHIVATLRYRAAYREDSGQ